MKPGVVHRQQAGTLQVFLDQILMTIEVGTICEDVGVHLFPLSV
jgi:hypothetical protein